MGSFIVTTDSGCDLPLSFCCSRGIIPLKMNYAIGDKNYTDTMDPKDLKSFYDGMRSGDTRAHGPMPFRQPICLCRIIRMPT